MRRTGEARPANQAEKQGNRKQKRVYVKVNAITIKSYFHSMILVHPSIHEARLLYETQVKQERKWKLLPLHMQPFHSRDHKNQIALFIPDRQNKRESRGADKMKLRWPPTVKD
jgi:hypothetical protein